MAEARIRRASMDDAEMIAQLHVDAWRKSYASLMPPEALSLLSVEEQAERWRDIFRRPSERRRQRRVFGDGRGRDVLRFGSCCRQRRPRLAGVGFPAEFSGLYLLRPAQRRGIGRALMGVMARHLIARGFSSASVWAFRDNPDARLFYEALGGEKTGIDGEWTVLGVTLPDMSYGWRDLSKLAAHQ